MNDETEDDMSLCFDCKKPIIIDQHLVDFDEDGNVYHQECLLNKRSCEAEESEF